MMGDKHFAEKLQNKLSCNMICVYANELSIVQHDFDEGRGDINLVIEAMQNICNEIGKLCEQDKVDDNEIKQVLDSLKTGANYGNNDFDE